MARILLQAAILHRRVKKPHLRRLVTRSFGLILLQTLLLVALGTTSIRAQPCGPTRVSVDSSGGPSIGHSLNAKISSNGRYVTFVNKYPHLMFINIDSYSDQILAHDLQTGTTALVSVALNYPWDEPANGDCSSPSLSANGRYVVFLSKAWNLPCNCSGGANLAYVFDRDLDNNGVFDESGPGKRRVLAVSISSDGTRANNVSFSPGISGDGRFVAFASNATNLVSGDTNGNQTRTLGTDIFVHDRDFDHNGVFDETQAGARRTIRVDVDSAGQQSSKESVSTGPSISADGRYVAYESNADNLVAGDTNGVNDVFLHDRDADGNGIFDEPGGIATIRVSVSSSGQQANGASGQAVISGDGRTVAFVSTATNLVPNDTNGVPDVFVRDLVSNTTVRVSLPTTGKEANGFCYAPSLSADGRFVAFHSGASNLVADDGNRAFDVFVHDRDADGNGRFDETNGTTTVRVSMNGDGNQADPGGVFPSLSADGRFVAFASVSANLVADDTNGVKDVFVVDRQCNGK